MKNIFLCATVLLFGFPLITFAQIEITEIMYDPEGSDTGREWIEVYNSGNSSVTILGGLGNTWRLHEESLSGSLNKRTFILSGDESSFVFPANSYLIIANNRTEFLKDHGTFSGLLVESRISLTNAEGKKLVIVDAGGTERSDSVTYAPIAEASNTGASLQKQPGGSWIPALPTPGASNSSVRYELSGEDETGGSGSASGGKDEFLNLESPWPFTDEIVYVNAGENRRVFVDEEITFFGEAQLRDSEEPHRAKFSWAFGDGRGESRRDAAHSYRRAGTYSAVLTVEFEGRIFRDRAKVQVIDKDSVKLGEVESDFVELQNTTDYEVDLSGWKIQNDQDVFEFALGTHVQPKSTVGIPLDKINLHNLFLLDSRGYIVDSLHPVIVGIDSARIQYQEILARLNSILGKLKETVK